MVGRVTPRAVRILVWLALGCGSFVTVVFSSTLYCIRHRLPSEVSASRRRAGCCRSFRNARAAAAPFHGSVLMPACSRTRGLAYDSACVRTAVVLRVARSSSRENHAPLSASLRSCRAPLARSCSLATHPWSPRSSPLIPETSRAPLHGARAPTSGPRARGGPRGEVGDGAFFNFGAFPEGLAQEHGGGRVAVGDDINEHGHQYTSALLVSPFRSFRSILDLHP